MIPELVQAIVIALDCLPEMDDESLAADTECSG